MNFIDKTKQIIRQLLANSEVPLQDIAEQSGLELEHLQKVVSGEDSPRFEDLNAVLEALDIDDFECLEEMKREIHIKHLDLGHNLVIENDELKTTLAESIEEQSQPLDEAFAELIEMADKIDQYYEQNNITN